MKTANIFAYDGTYAMVILNKNISGLVIHIQGTVWDFLNEFSY